MQEMCQGCPRLRYVVDKSVQPPDDAIAAPAGHSLDSDVRSRENQ